MNRNFNERYFNSEIFSNGIVNYISDDQIFRQKELVKKAPNSFKSYGAYQLM